MLRMRAVLAIALSAFGVAAFCGADHARAGSLGARVAPIVVYDYQPGVRVRAYWLAPWRHRHYYPTTGGKSEVEPVEDPSADARGAPAETFHREWSTSSAVAIPQTYWPEPPRSAQQPADPYPDPDTRDSQPPQYRAPVKP
jgi:hypothetical protein